MITYNFCLMHDPQIPNFYFASLESGPLLDDFDGPEGPQGCVKSKSCISQMLIIHGPLQFLFYALPPNSQLLFCEPGIGPLFEAFARPVEPQGCVKSKS